MLCEKMKVEFLMPVTKEIYLQIILHAVTILEHEKHGYTKDSKHYFFLLPNKCTLPYAEKRT